MYTAAMFTMDNTEGYTQAQLVELNGLLEAALLAEFGPDADLSENPAKSTADHIAERVQAEYDLRAENA